MTELALPHLAPIRFAKSVISKDDNKVIVKNEFATIPSLGMLIEAAAQSSAAFANEDTGAKVGYLTLLKNIKLLKEPSSLEYNITLLLTLESNGSMYLSFEVNEEDEVIATGVLMVTSA